MISAPRRVLNIQVLLIALMLAIFAVAFFSPVRESESSDPWGALLVSQAIIEQRSIKLDSYPQAAAALGYRIVQLNGYTFYAFPLGTSLAAVPAVAVALLFGMDMTIPADEYALQNLLSALSSAAMLGLGYLVCRAILPPHQALAVAFITLTATALLPTMGSALWSSNLAVLCSTGALALLMRPQQSWQRAVLIGLLLVGAYVARPSSVSFIVPTTLFVLLVWRWRAWPLLISGALGVALFVLFSLITHGAPLPLYYRGASRQIAPDPAWAAIALYGLLFSPGRGLFVFSPQLLLVLLGALAWFRRLRHEPIFWLCIGWLGVHLALLTLFYHWWGGYSYGSRLFADAIPALLPLTALIWREARQSNWRQRRIAALLFSVLTVIGIAINSGQGLFNRYVTSWNIVAAGYYDIDSLPDLLFDWRYPQFLASEAQFQQRDEALRAQPPQPNSLFGRRVWNVLQLRGRLVWTPHGVQVPPELAVLLDPGWHDYEPAWGGRWMRAEASLWVESEQEREVELWFKPYSLNAGGAAGSEGRLAVQVGNAPPEILTITTVDSYQMKVRLSAGSTRIHFRFLGGEAFMGNDPRPLALALETIELRPFAATQP